MAEVEIKPVDFTEAIDFLKNKVAVPSRAWTDLWEGMHSVAFTVAGATSEAVVTDFHKAVTEAIERGTTLADFRKEFDRIVAEHGWQYKGSPGWRSRVIFETNLRMAYSAGRWAQIERLKRVRPYLRYVTADDERVRPEHRQWHNVVLPVDHPWWRTHFPPNGWGCRCRVVSLNDRDLKRYGLKLSDAPPSRTVAREVRTPDGPITVEVPEGIDPGFAYNPGAGAFGRGAGLTAQERHGGWTRLTAPGNADTIQAEAGDLPPLPVDEARAAPLRDIPAGDESALRSALREALGADEALLTDPTGAGILVGQAIVDHILESPKRQDGRGRYFPLIPDLIRDPAEIWVGFAEDRASGRVAMRRRYVKLFRIGKETAIGIVADADGRQWSGITFFRGNVRGARNLRSGHLVYRRK